VETILIDTSVWINVFKGIETNASLFLKHNSEKFKIATCPIIIQEVLQGITDDKSFDAIKNYFSGLVLLSANAHENALESARLYRILRKKGITIRKPNDCLIAIYAIKNELQLLHDDKDFTNIAAFSNLKSVRI
jgi:predicted nucleic acid-binding protein